MADRILDSFEQHIKTYHLFSEQEIAVIKSCAIPKRIKKKEYLLREGSICRFHTFVCSGCLRSYRIDSHGNEHIFSLSPANHWVNDRVSLETGAASNECIDALEESTIIQLSADSFRSLLKEIPNFDEFNTRIIVEECSAVRDRIYMMLSYQAEERYRQFIHRFPHLQHRLPMFMIASYLGVKRETLARIRSNMTNLIK